MKIPIQIQMTAGENGATALSMMLGYFGKYVPIQEVRSVCVTSRNGTSPEQMKEAAEYYGLIAEVQKIPEAELPKASLPLLISWKKRYYGAI